MTSALNKSSGGCNFFDFFFPGGSDYTKYKVLQFVCSSQGSCISIQFENFKPEDSTLKA